MYISTYKIFLSLGGFVTQKVRSYAQLSRKVKLEEFGVPLFGANFPKLWAISTQQVSIYFWNLRTYMYNLSLIIP